MSFEWRERESERAKLDTHWLNFDFSFLYFSFLNWLDTVVRQLASYSSSPSQSLFGDERAKTTKKTKKIKKNCRIAFVVIISIYALRLLFCLCHSSVFHSREICLSAAAFDRDMLACFVRSKGQEKKNSIQKWQFLFFMCMFYVRMYNCLFICLCILLNKYWHKRGATELLLLKC